MNLGFDQTIGRRGTLVVSLIAILALTSMADVATAEVVTPPDWKRKPTREDLLAVWPTKALQRGVGGYAKIVCKVAVQGALYDCTITSESPAGMGFGQAALALTPQFLMTPKKVDGKPVGGAEVSIPINFVDPGVPTGSHIAGTGGLDGTRRSVSHLAWLMAPTYRDVVEAYPRKAREQRLGGHVVLNCMINAEGRLLRCETVTEYPVGLGLAGAAKSLTGRFTGPRALANGTPLDGVYTQIAFTFDPAMLTAIEPIVGKPQWARLPEVSSVEASYPHAALEAKVATGRATLSCLVGMAGKLEACEVTSQEPAGYGFGAAALALSTDFLVTIWTSEGLPTVGGRVRVPIRYELPPPAEAARP